MKAMLAPVNPMKAPVVTTDRSVIINASMIYVTKPGYGDHQPPENFYSVLP